MIKVKHLLVKVTKGDPPLVNVEKLIVSKNGIVDNVPCLPTRQILILPNSTLSEYALQPGDLRENIIIDDYDIHSVESGTVLTIGNVDIRLTYHCEPCARVTPFVNPKVIAHKRGYFGNVINEGEIRIGDNVIIGQKQFDSIPYDIKERILWFLSNRNEKVTIKQLAYEIGLTPGYYRAIPTLMKKMDRKFKDLVITQNQEHLKT